MEKRKESFVPLNNFTNNIYGLLDSIYNDYTASE